MLGTILGLGVVVWLATLILVESEFTRPLREWLDEQANLWTTVWNDGEPVWMNNGYTDPDHVRFDKTREVFWRKARYLAGCHLCAGCWIAAATVAVVPVHAFRAGFVGFVLDAALIKAVAHLTLVLHKAGEAVAR